MKRNAVYKYIGIVIILFFICSEIISLVSLREIWSGFLFFLFFTCGLFFPGMAITALVNLPIRKLTVWIALSLFLGYCADLLLYLLVMLLGLKSMAWILIAVVFLFSIPILWKKLPVQAEAMEPDLSGWKLICLTGGAMFLISLVTYCGNNYIPQISGESTVVQDILYWSGNASTLAKGFPPIDFRHYPRAYSYHYFSSMQLALANLVTGIPAVKLCVAFTVLQSVALRVFGGYTVLSLCTSVKKHAWLGMLLLFFATGLEDYSFVFYTAHNYGACFGMEYGFACFLFFLAFLILVHRSAFNWRYYALLLISFFVMYGLKSTYASVAICGVGVCCIGWLIKKQISKAVLVGVSILVLFGVGYLLIASVSGYTGGRSGVVTNIPMYKTHMADIYQTILQYLRSEVLALPVFYLLFFFTASPVCLAAAVFTAIRLTKEKKWESIDFAFLTMMAAGYFITLQFTMNGISNMYFAMASFPSVIVWFIMRLDTGKAGKAERILTTAAAAISVLCFGYIIVRLGREMIRNYSPEITYEKRDARGYLNADEVEAYYWLRDHADSNSLITANRSGLTVGAMTEKYVLEGGPDSPLFAAQSDQDILTVIRDYQEEGIDYIVYDMTYSPDFTMPAEVCDVVFQNNATIIYRIN